MSSFAFGFFAGGVTWAPLADRLPVRFILTGLYLSGVGTMALMLQVHAPWQAFMAALAFGMLVGGSIQLPTMLLANYFGRAHIGAIGGTVHMARGFGLGSGPVIGGLLIDGDRLRGGVGDVRGVRSGGCGADGVRAASEAARLTLECEIPSNDGERSGNCHSR